MVQNAEHPRARGENRGSRPWKDSGPGTSPRTRGKHSRCCGRNHRGRNIPAHAGKTCCTQHVGCGWPGTSPRTRGKLSCTLRGRDWERNIPAHAGKTITVVTPDGEFEEHPRARGENSPKTPTSPHGTGTSPRTRGKLGDAISWAWNNRNIPAHAGKTLIDVRFLVPEGHFTFGFVFLHRGGSMESPCSSLLSECFSARIVVYGQLGTSLLSAYGCAFWWDGG